MADGTTASELDALSTEDLRHRAFTLAVHRHDVAFLWSVFKHLPHSEQYEDVDGWLGDIGASVSDAVAAWREFTGHGGYGDSEPLLRAAFIDYIQRHETPSA